jgi:hypothetical protein
LTAHTATLEHGGFVVTVPRILDRVTRHWSNVFPVFYSECLWVRISTRTFVVFSCFRGTFFFMKVLFYISCNFSFTNATCQLCITLQFHRLKGLIGKLILRLVTTKGSPRYRVVGRLVVFRVILDALGKNRTPVLSFQPTTWGLLRPILTKVFTKLHCVTDCPVLSCVCLSNASASVHSKLRCESF